MTNLKEIIEAWVISNNPTEKQRNLAEERSKICESCPSRRTLTKKLKITTYCSECGCPIVKKIFTNSFNPCDLKKWQDVDSKYMTPKTLKTII